MQFIVRVRFPVSKEGANVPKAMILSLKFNLQSQGPKGNILSVKGVVLSAFDLE